MLRLRWCRTSQTWHCHRPYCAWGLSMAKSIPGTLGRMSFGPRWVSCTQMIAHWCLLMRSAISCCFAAERPSTLKGKTVRVGPEKVVCVWLWPLSFPSILKKGSFEGGGRIAVIDANSREELLSVDTNSLRHLPRRSGKNCNLQFANSDIILFKEKYIIDYDRHSP